MLRTTPLTLGMSETYFPYGVDGAGGESYGFSYLPLFEGSGGSYYQWPGGQVMVNVELAVELTLKGPPMTSEPSGVPFQSVGGYVDPRAVIESDDSPLSSPLTSPQSNGSVSPYTSASPFMGARLVTDASSYPEQPNCYGVISPQEVPFTSHVVIHRPITPTSPDLVSIHEDPPTPQPIPRPKVPTSVRRRGPGRPTKAQAAANHANSKRPTGHSAVKVRRQMHNDSAMRSRARLNKALEDLWTVIPAQERTAQLIGEDDNREVCRAVKVEVAIGYLRKLQAQLPNLN
jgi:hypothetical protein